MKVKAREARPIKQKDGSWDVVIIEHEEDIPDKGREPLICNKCPLDKYPECKEWCKILAKNDDD